MVYSCADKNDGFYPSEDRTIIEDDGKDVVFHIAFNSLENGRQFLRDLKASSSVCRVTSIKMFDEVSIYGSNSVIFGDDLFL